MLKFLTLLTFLLMVVVNALANILPINGISTGAVSDAYPNLFAPAGSTFAIWGLIYLLLGLYVLAQWLPLPGGATVQSAKSAAKSVTKAAAKTSAIVRQRVNRYFILSSLVNASWIMAWHHQLIGVSLLLMLVLLWSLIRISALSNTPQLPPVERALYKIPFGVYSGWITIATIANVTTWLVSLGWSNWWLSDQTWTVLVLLVGVLIAAVTTIRERNFAYGLVPIWAYWGIYLKHTSADGFAGAYPPIVATTIVCIALLVGVNGWVLRGK